MWGVAAETKTIHLNQNASFRVTANLEAALQVLRLPDRARMIWIDAICINQGDVQERNRQVQLMRKIYRNAETVRVWLDIDIDPSNPAIVKLQTLNHQSTKEDLGTDASFWEPLSAVFKDPYWMRVWIQQEVSNATSLAIQCRKVPLSVFNLYHYVRITHERVDEVDMYTPIWIDWAHVRPNVHLPKRFGLDGGSSQPVQGSTLSGQDLNLLETLSLCFKLECADDRDRVYGILYLAHDYSEGDIAINYEHSVDEVYTSVAKFTLRKYSSLNFILDAGVNWKDPDKERTLPTWVPDWRGPSMRMWSSCSPKFSQAAPPFMPRLRPSFSANDAVLHAYGMCIDRIDQIICLPQGVDLYNTPTAIFLDTCRSITRMAISKRPDAERDEHKDEFCFPQWHAVARTLTAVDNFKPEDPDAHDKLRRTVSISADGLVEASQSPEAKSEDRPLLMVDIIRMNMPTTKDSGQVFSRLAWGIIGKHLPFVGINGGIGLALESAKVGDEVWIVFGCDKPMILRSVDDHYLVVGEGYYDGANRGELLKDAPENVSVGDVVGSYKVESMSLC
jgi:hypothetical protein